MAVLIMCHGKVQYCGPDWDALENYPSKPAGVFIYPYQNSRAGKIEITYEDGAIGHFNADSFSTLSDYMRDMARDEGWPQPRIFHQALPKVGVDDDVPLTEPEQQADPEPDPAPVKARTRRTRVAEETYHESSPDRGNKTNNQARVRRVRAG